MCLARPLRAGPADRAGVTLVELLVAIGVLALLMAIVLPAVHAARAAARRTECAAHLQEIGVATQNFHQAREELPIGDRPLYELLPYVEQAALYAELSKPAAARVGPFLSPPLYRCPDDPYALAGHLHVNYRINEGSGFANDGFTVFGNERLRFRDITDGLSATGMFSEGVIGANDYPYKQRDDAVARRDPNRYLWHLDRSWKSGEEHLFIEQCLDPGNHLTTVPGLLHGATAVYGGTERPYNHLVPPNRPGCLNTPPDELLSFTRAHTPTSFHTGGVTLLLCDGGVRFVSDAIDQKTWRHLGSRNGNDIVGPF